MIVNSRMQVLLAQAPEETWARPLPEALQEIVDAGWGYRSGGSLLLAALCDSVVDAPPPGEQYFATEYHVNDIWVLGEDLDPTRDVYLRAIAGRALVFAWVALNEARQLPEFGTLAAVVGTGVADDFLLHGTTVRFFTRRGDYPSWFDDLESYELEAMALLDASDARRPLPPLMELRS
ncbi:hypothetical protein GCM10022226_53260 [Sphaerisporangium flaviroseum]|uniref:Uncharacterized protein n=1 Tax=Sphaerisporangium flaviroseum TaxID=509199 RepID=A0ABP7ISF3_9ACTN